MVLYLCRHGDALAREINPDRPLSERGTADIRKMADALAGRVDTPLILHSGKTRARQTAELLHELLAPDAVIRADPNLDPDSPVEEISSHLEHRNANLMLVAHLPFLGRLASRLLAPDVVQDFIAFESGTVAALARDQDGRWRMAWMLTPTLAHG